MKKKRADQKIGSWKRMPPVKKVYVRIGVCYNRGAFEDRLLVFLKNAPGKRCMWGSAFVIPGGIQEYFYLFFLCFYLTTLYVIL